MIFGALLWSAVMSAAVPAPFIRIEQTEPISQKTLITFGTVQDGNGFGMSCFEGGERFRISVAPKRFYGSPGGAGLFAPTTVHRFSRAPKPQADRWSYLNETLQFKGIGALRQNKQIASFIHNLRRDDTFSIRYEPMRGRGETLTFNYKVSDKDLDAFLSECAPKRVLRYLDEWRETGM